MHCLRSGLPQRQQRSRRISLAICESLLRSDLESRVQSQGRVEHILSLFQIIEGVITVASVALAIWFLPDYPSSARWLSDDDKKYVEDRINVKGGGFTKRHATKQEIMQTVCSPRMMGHYFAYMVNCIPLGSLTFFTPTIVTGLGYDSIKAQLMTVPPWVVGYFFSLFLGWSADRWNARGFHVTVASLLGAIGWVTAGSLPADAYTQRYGMLFFCACGAFPSSGPLSAWVVSIN